MMLVDYYAKYLFEHGATEIHFASDKAVRFCLPSGDQTTDEPFAHGQLAQLVEQAADTEKLDELSIMGCTVFEHAAEGLPPVRLEVEIEDEVWKVVLKPASAPAAAPAAKPAPAQAPAAAPAAKATPATASPAPAATPAKPAAQPVAAPAPGEEPAFNRLLRKMVALEASDVHMSTGMPPMVRIHGTMQPLEERAGYTEEEIRELLMPICPRRNAEEFEAEWDTDFAHTVEGVARFRANLFRDRHGMGGVFRQIPFDILTPEQLGLPPQVLDLCWLSKGLVVVTGPTGSGKSTTLATLVDQINEKRTDHIITIEDPIEFVHKNKSCLINQREVGTHTKGFKKALRAALREDPDVVLVGEMRDLETIAIAIETAETGHLVFGTLHTTTATSTVDRMIDQFPADRQAQIRTMLSESLRGVIAQTLLKKEGGGRVAGFEVLLVNNAVSNLIREGKTYQLISIMQTGRKHGMQTLNEHLINLVKNKLVKPEEAYIKAYDKAGMKDMFEKHGITLHLE